MNTISRVPAVAAAALFAFTGAAVAQTSATATTDLNIRSGPGPEHAVIGVVNADSQVSVNGCLEGSKWCTIAHEGGQGWVYSDYLTADVSGTATVLTEGRTQVGVPVVTYEAQETGESADADEAAGAAGVASGAATGAIAGALIGGPIGAAVGGVAGAAAGGVTGAAVAAIDPPDEVRTYVTTNQVDPVYLEGEVVVGAGLPETVELREIPDYQYRYVYVNGQPVLVEPESRRIVYVVR